MDAMTLSSLTQYVPDAILILISGSACLYCGLLNRKLKNLNNLKSGVGASIVSLTEAIEQTHQAAQQAEAKHLQIQREANNKLQALKDIDTSLPNDETSQDTLNCEKNDLNITDLFDLRIASDNTFRPKLTQKHNASEKRKIAL